MAVKTKTAKRVPYKKGKVQEKLYQIIPFLLIVGLVPLVVYIKRVTFTDPGNMYMDGRQEYFDVFSYYKMILFLLFTAASLLIFLFTRKSVSFDTQMKKYYIPMGIYILFVALSAFLSEYKTVAFWGFRERFEGAFVLIAYIITMFLAANMMSEEKSIKLLFAFLLGSAFVISVLGTLQLFGFDYFKFEFIKRLITPASLKSEGSEGVVINSNFPPKSVFVTLYNPNYVGSYMAMLVPIILTFLVLAKKNIHRIILVPILCLAVISAVGCKSRAGIVGIFVSVLIIIIMLAKKILRYKWIVLASIVALSGILIAVNFGTQGMLYGKVKQIVSSAISNFIDIEPPRKLDKVLEGLIDLSLDSEKAKVVTDKGTLQIAVKERVLKITDENNKELAYNFENNIVSLTDDRFENIKLDIKTEEGKIGISYNDYRLIDIVVTKDGLFSLSNIWMLYRNDKRIEAFGFKGLETLGSSRGYIWSRTLPLLKDTILIGPGTGYLSFVFPPV